MLPVLPEIESPYENVTFDEKIVITISTGIIFLFGQLPIYGLKPNSSLFIEDPFYQFRSIFAMEKGTLLELGLLPVITSGFVWQILAGFKKIKVHLGVRSERELFQTGQKITSLVISLIYCLGLIFSNYYGSSVKGLNVGETISIGSSLFIIYQVLGMSFFLTLLVETFDKGYGFGSGILCLLTLQYATNFVKDVVGLELIPLANSNKLENYGALTNLIRNFSFNPKELGKSVLNSFTRSELPNLNQFYISLIVILVSIGINNFRIELPIRSTKMRGMNNIYPIKLLYTGALPLLFAFTVLANIQVIGFFLVKLTGNAILGDYKSVNNQLVLTNGVLYYLSLPSSIYQFLINPLRTVITGSLVIFLSCWFANYWSYFSGSSAVDIAKQFKEQGITIGGKRDASIVKELGRIIPVASVSGAFLITSLALVGEFLGGFGKAVTGVVGICSAFGIMEEFIMESQQNGGNSQLMSSLANYQ